MQQRGHYFLFFYTCIQKFSMFSQLWYLFCFSGFIHFGINRFVGEEEDTKPNHYGSEEEYLDVDDDEEEEEEEATTTTTIGNINSSSKPQFANFSVLSLLARKTPDKEKGKQSQGGNYSEGDKQFPPSGEDVAVEKDEGDTAEQFAQVERKYLIIELFIHY